MEGYCIRANVEMTRRNLLLIRSQGGGMVEHLYGLSYLGRIKPGGPLEDARPPTLYDRRILLFVKNVAVDRAI